MTIFTKNTRLLILLGLLVIGAAYYFVVQGPIAKQTETCKNNIASLEEQITVLEPKVVQKKQWETELAEIREKAENGEISFIAEYDNIINIISELNFISASAGSFNIDFSPETISDNIAARNIRITYSVNTYYDALRLLQALHDSRYLYVIRNVSLSIRSPSYMYSKGYSWDYRTGKDGSYDVSLTLTDFEFCP